MAISLKDQLLKAGLADNKRARQADHAKRQAAKGKHEGESAALAVQKAREAQVEKDREASRQFVLQQEQKAVAAQIRQLIEAHRIERKGGELSYQFTHERKVKKLLVSEPQQYQLIHGQIAIVTLDSQYELVPTAIAEKIQQRDPSPIVLLNTRQASVVADDDPYANYQIPDDLMW